jgi:hypothetical protein
MKLLSLFLQGLLLGNRRYAVDLANIAGFALTNILSITRVFDIARSDILPPILFVSRTWGHVSFTSLFYRITKGNGATGSMFGWHDKKEERPWPLGDISYVVLKRRDDANPEGNSITNSHVTRGP